MYSTTIAAVIINLLATVVAPFLGVQIGTEQITTFVQVLISLATGAWIWYQRYQQGGVTKLGFRK